MNVAPTHRGGLIALRHRDYSVVVVDDCLAEANPAAADLLWQSFGMAVPVQINFAILRGLETNARSASGDWPTRTAAGVALRAAVSQLENDLKSTVTGLLLQSQLALAEPELTSKPGRQIRPGSRTRRQPASTARAGAIVRAPPHPCHVQTDAALLIDGAISAAATATNISTWCKLESFSTLRPLIAESGSIHKPGLLELERSIASMPRSSGKATQGLHKCRRAARTVAKAERSAPGVWPMHLYSCGADSFAKKPHIADPCRTGAVAKTPPAWQCRKFLVQGENHEKARVIGPKLFHRRSRAADGVLSAGMLIGLTGLLLLGGCNKTPAPAAPAAEPAPTAQTAPPPATRRHSCPCPCPSSTAGRDDGRSCSSPCPRRGSGAPPPPPPPKKYIVAAWHPSGRPHRADDQC